MKKKIIKFLEIEQLTKLQEPLYINVEKALKKKKKTKTDIINIRDFAALNLVYGCALRISEMCNLKTHNLDLQNKVIRVVNGKTGDRFVPIPENTLKWVNKWLEIRPNWENNNYVFCNVKGSTRPDNNIVPIKRMYWNKLLKRLAIQTNVRMNGGEELLLPHPHTLRHSRAMALRDNNIPLDIIQNILGHKSINTTANEYLIVRQEKLIEAQNMVTGGIF